MNANETRSEIARIMDEIEVATKAEWYGLLGMVYGVNQRDFLLGRPAGTPDVLF